MAEFSFTIVYLPGLKNLVADSLSRSCDVAGLSDSDRFGEESFSGIHALHDLVIYGIVKTWFKVVASHLVLTDCTLKIRESLPLGYSVVSLA